MEKIKSVFIKDEMIPTMEEFEKIRWREHKSFSQLTCMAMYEYVQNHKEGNDTYTLDQFDTDAMSATPAFFREKDVWKQWIRNLPKKDHKKFDNQVNVLLNLTDERFGEGFD